MFDFLQYILYALNCNLSSWNQTFIEDAHINCMCVCVYGIQNEAQHKKWTITNAKPCDVTHTTVHSHTRTYIYGCIETCWFIWFRYWTATCQSSITVSGGMSFANALISRFHCYMAHIGKSDYNEYDEFIIHKSGLQTNAKPHEAHCWKVFSFKFTTAVGLCVCVCPYSTRYR